MIRSGMIKKTAAGIYNWLPIGLKVLKKVEDIVRDNLNKFEAQEILMPMVQPAELWKESLRYNEYGKELLKFKDRSDRDFVLGPTHEEIGRVPRHRRPWDTGNSRNLGQRGRLH